MKLIDADKLTEAVEIRMKSKEDDSKAVAELRAINRYIAQLSPDYDIDKVVEKLTELNKPRHVLQRVGVGNTYDYQTGVIDAIEVVQAGLLNPQN